MANIIEVESLPSWPVTLPIAPLLAAYSEQHPNLATSVTAGNKTKLIRRASTRTQIPISVDFNFSKEQMTLFETFVYTTLEGGSIRFTFVHPRTEQAIEVSFDASQQNLFTITPNGSMRYFKVATQFLVWS